MSSFLGIDFFRIVNEGLVDDWAQVYAKVPFEEDDLLNKGALFGVLRIKDSKKLVSKGSDIFLWLDDYFSQSEEKGGLTGLMEGILEVNSKLQAAWVWVITDDESGKRMMKAAAVNGGEVVIIRNGQRVVLADQGTDKRVVVGDLKEGDKLGLAVGGMVGEMGGLADKKKLEEVAFDLNDRFLKEKEKAVAGLLLEVKKTGGVLSAVLQKPSFGKEDSEEDGPVEEQTLAKTRLFKKQLVEDSEVVAEKDRLVGSESLIKKKVFYWLAKLKSFKKNQRLVVEVKKKKKDNKTLWLGMLFLILFAVSVVGGVIKSKKEKIRDSWQDEISSWQRREDEAVGLAQVNPAGARKLLMEVRKEVKEAESSWLGTKYEKDWLEYKAKLDESWTKVSGEKKVTPKLFLGLSLIRSGLTGDKIVDLGKDVEVVSLESGLAMKINYEDKEAKVVASDKNKEWKDMGGNESQEVFLVSSGLILADEKARLEFDDTVSEPIRVEVFGKNAYVLDAGLSEVWRFALTKNSISDRRRWLNPGQEMGMGEVVDMDIDGDIWILGKKGEVGKLRRGNRERFSLKGVPENMKGDRIAVQPDGEELAVLDVSGSRVAVFNKDSGDYLQQLKWDGFSKAKDILYTEEGRMMVLSENKLYWVE